jgi:hypothetical protein
MVKLKKIFTGVGVRIRRLSANARGDEANERFSIG